MSNQSTEKNSERTQPGGSAVPVSENSPTTAPAPLPADHCGYCGAKDNGTCAYPSGNRPGCLLPAHRERMRAGLDVHALRTRLSNYGLANLVKKSSPAVRLRIAAACVEALDQFDRYEEQIYLLRAEKERFRAAPLETPADATLVLRICTAYEQGFGMAGRDFSNPYHAPSQESEAWNMGFQEGLKRFKKPEPMIAAPSFKCAYCKWTFPSVQARNTHQDHCRNYVPHK